MADPTVSGPIDKLRVCMVAPFPPRRGGVTVQTALLVRYLEQEGVDVLNVDTNLSSLRVRGLGPLRLIVQPWVVLFRLLRCVPKCDVAHFQSASYWGFMPTIIGVPIAKLFGKRVVLSYHGGRGAQFMDRFGWAARIAFRMANKATVVSDQLRDAFAAMGIETELVGNLFDAQLIRFRERTTIGPRLVWTRNMEEVYDPVAAAKVYELVRECYPEATLVMAGDGSLSGSVNNHLRERGLTGIKMTGRLPADGIANVLDENDIYLNTSKIDGLPTSLLEAAASGLPIVTTAAGGIPSLFENGVSARIVDVGDVRGLADAVLDLLRNPEKAKSMGTAARTVATAYTWERVSNDIARIYGLTDGWPRTRKDAPETNACAGGKRRD